MVPFCPGLSCVPTGDFYLLIKLVCRCPHEMNYVQSSQRYDGKHKRKVNPVLVQLKTLQTRSPSCDFLDLVSEE